MFKCFQLIKDSYMSRLSKNITKDEIDKYKLFIYIEILIQNRILIDYRKFIKLSNIIKHEIYYFTNVFYIQLPSNNMVSQLWDEEDKKINMEIKEGDILTFPGFISHNSKINLSDKQKIVISFNFSLECI